VKTYDPKKIDIIFAGIRIGGFADGTFLKIAPKSPRFTSKSGVDGEVTRSRMHDTRRDVEFTLMQTSETNDRLSAVFKADVDSVNGEGVGAFMVQDRNGSTLIEGTAYITTDPDAEFAGEAGPRVWKLELVEGSATHGGNPSV
jgi:hypothetical protein